VAVCPLLFEPIYKPKIWGGRRFETLLGRTLPGPEPIGESWEVADLEQDQSVARAGDDARGRTLGQLVRDWGRDLFGQAELFGGRFPLLLKYLDAHDVLSVQVHPDAAMAAALGGNVRVKNEAWYILHADENGAIYRGLEPGTDERSFQAAIKAGRVQETLRRIPVSPGQCYYLPSGTVHALGAGVMVAEIQTPSDITYRVYDWDRIDPATGMGRELHIEQALQCITFEPREFVEEKRSHVASVWTSMTRLITCPSFIVERVRMTAGIDQPIPYAELVVWMVLEGRGRIGYGSGDSFVEFATGDTIVLPAGLGDARVITNADCVWLEITLPKGSKSVG
jgi:mannose-6-phosphate isomerase